MTGLETVWVDVSEHALEPFERAFSQACRTVGFFLTDERARLWRVEGVKDAGASEATLTGALALAALVTGEAPELHRAPTEAGGWLARTQSSFPEQLIGRRFAIRGTHLKGPGAPGRIVLTLDAGVAFGSGEHGSTRGCILALERVAHRRLRRVLDLGCGSGILAMAAARLLHRRVLASDNDPWSVRVARANAVLNGLQRQVHTVVAHGWQPAVRRRGPYDLVFGNILARPLCAMAAALHHNLAPGGTAILAGLLDSQARMVLAAHRRTGLVLDSVIRDAGWTCLVLRRPA